MIMKRGKNLKSFTKRNKNYWNEKYPIKSTKTNNVYYVKIASYKLDDENYTNGCIVSLYKKRIIVGYKKLIEKYLCNKNGKIEIEYIYSGNFKTDYDYNLINLTKVIVEHYERLNYTKHNSLSKIEKDYIEFEKWDGNC